MRSNFVCAVMLFLVDTGCGRSPSVSPVVGTVRFQGQPLGGAAVTFAAVGGGPIAVAICDKEGRFKLQTRLGSRDESGAIPGEYRVAISKFVPPAGMDEVEYERQLEEERTEREKAVPAPKSPLPPRQELLPPEYSDIRQTKLSATVTASGTNRVTFDIP